MIKVGDTLPDVQFNVPTSEGMKQLRTAEVFAGKTIALFAVPGAFTPTCSARHLPSFRDNLAAFKEKGVEAIVTESSVCSIHLKEGTGLPTWHPLELL